MSSSDKSLPTDRGRRVVRRPLTQPISTSKQSANRSATTSTFPNKTSDDPVEKLRMRLSSPRLRPKGTIVTYLQSARRLMQFIAPEKRPTDDDFRRYFMWRRQSQISERTLLKEFFQLKLFAQTNDWSWPFTKFDAPEYKKGPSPPGQPIDDIRALIAARDKLSKEELFYLAVSTTWGCRREELSRIKKRDFDATTIHIDTAKHGVPKKHLIPDCLKPVFEAYNPRPITPNALSTMYNRICRKAKVKVEPRSGWHRIRKSVETMIHRALVKADLEESWVADYMGWSQATKGTTFSNSAMAGTYDHPELLDKDPWYQEKSIIAIHPFLKFWMEPPAPDAPVKKSRRKKQPVAE